MIDHFSSQSQDLTICEPNKNILMHFSLELDYSHIIVSTFSQD